jgi:hypothetical protein
MQSILRYFLVLFVVFLSRFLQVVSSSIDFTSSTPSTARIEPFSTTPARHTSLGNSIKKTPQRELKRGGIIGNERIRYEIVRNKEGNRASLSPVVKNQEDSSSEIVAGKGGEQVNELIA